MAGKRRGRAREPRPQQEIQGLSAALALAAVVALAVPAGAGARIVVHERAGKGASGLSAKAIQRAEPRSLLRAPRGGADAYPAAASAGGSGSVAGLPPTAPAPTAREPAASAAAVGPFQNGEVTDPTAYPNSANGKLFGRIPGTGPYTCSAAVVRARNHSVIFTAGHCVKNPGPGGWARELTFVPAFTRGASPFDRWHGKAILTSSQWATHGNTNFDYAAIVLGRHDGRRIGNVTGALGFAYGIRRDRSYRAVGYPSNKANARLMWECVSDFEGPDPFYRAPGPVPIGIGCNMRSGASGGGWTITRNRLASVSSFGFTDRPNELYGPHFTERADRLRRKAGRQ